MRFDSHFDRALRERSRRAALKRRAAKIRSLQEAHNAAVLAAIDALPIRTWAAAGGKGAVDLGAGGVELNARTQAKGDADTQGDSETDSQRSGLEGLVQGTRLTGTRWRCG